MDGISAPSINLSASTGNMRMKSFEPKAPSVAPRNTKMITASIHPGATPSGLGKVKTTKQAKPKVIKQLDPANPAAPASPGIENANQ